MPVLTVRSLSDSVLSYTSTSSGKRPRSSAASTRSTSGPSALSSARTPPGTMQSIIRRCPKQRAAARSTCSRSQPNCAWSMTNEASLHTAPMSPQWLARRSSSAISARSQTARGGGSTPLAASTAREGERVGDGAVARHPAGKSRGKLERRAGHQRLGALVRVAKPLFEPHHRLAVGRETEVPWLDDAGVHRPDRDLVQALAFRRQEAIRLIVAQPLPCIG